MAVTGAGMGDMGGMCASVAQRLQRRQLIAGRDVGQWTVTFLSGQSGDVAHPGLGQFTGLAVIGQNVMQQGDFLLADFIAYPGRGTASGKPVDAAGRR